ncbi:MAG: acyltransferase family protein [Sandaracinaceae bacterium]|nr:acyltransferase family protein [Sandaracinaceae bacterium]
MSARGIDRWLESERARGAARGLIRYFSARLEGAEHLPREGGALLVGNHAVFGLDAFVLGALLATEVGRLPTWLAERQLWKTPLLPRALDFVGAIAGERGAAARHLAAGELVVVYPGGIHDSYKLARDRHRLMWGERVGFAHVAMTARVPIVPVAGCGIDDVYRVVGREPGLGKLLFGDERYNFPIALGRRGTLVPRRVPLTFRMLAPIDTNGDPESPADVARVRDQTRVALEGALCHA